MDHYIYHSFSYTRTYEFFYYLYHLFFSNLTESKVTEFWIFQVWVKFIILRLYHSWIITFIILFHIFVLMNFFIIYIVYFSRV